MFKNLIHNFKARKLARGINNHPIYGLVVGMLRSTLADNSNGLGKYASEKTRQTILAQVLGETEKILISPNPVMANRERLTATMLSFAKWQVLVLPSASEESVEPTGLRGKPGVTGELKPHVSTLAKTDKDLKELVFELSPHATEADLRDSILFRYWRAANDLNVWNAVRMVLGDCHPDGVKDWFHPFVASACAWEEHLFRQQLGLADVIAEQDSYGTIAALKHSTFMNFVLDGSRYPTFEWEEHYKKPSESDGFERLGAAVS
jgi:hypothetical protein